MLWNKLIEMLKRTKLSLGCCYHPQRTIIAWFRKKRIIHLASKQASLNNILSLSREKLSFCKVSVGLHDLKSSLKLYDHTGSVIHPITTSDLLTSILLKLFPVTYVIKWLEILVSNTEVVLLHNSVWYHKCIFLCYKIYLKNYPQSHCSQKLLCLSPPNPCPTPHTVRSSSYYESLGMKRET